ncbi:MAG: VCBS repeat-containing protein [Cyclobacteriaceae bacterium]
MRTISFSIGILAFLIVSNCSTSLAQKKGSDIDTRFTLMKESKTKVQFNNKISESRFLNIFIYSNFYGGGGVAVGDFNNDGLQDIFFGGNLVADRLYLNKGNLEFEDITKSAGIIDNGGWSSGIALADVNNDGFIDIYVCRELYDDKIELRKNQLYINNGNLTFTESAGKYGIADMARSRHAVFFDYDNDDDPDLFVLNQPPNPGSASTFKGTNLSLPEYASKLYRNDGGIFTDVSMQAGVAKTSFPNSVSASDFDKDGWIDLYVANDFDSPDYFYKNNGDGTFSNILDTSMRHISYFSMGVDAADVNNDGMLDIMVLDMVAEDNYRLKANMSGMNPRAFMDVYNRGGHYQYMFNTLHLNQGNDIYSDAAQLAGVSSTDWSWSNVFADFDNDGFKDLHVTNGLLRDIRNTDAAKKVSEEIRKRVKAYYEANPSHPRKEDLDIVDLDEILALIPSERLSNYLFKNTDGYRFDKKMQDWGMDQKTFSGGSAYADLDNDGDLDLIVNNINKKAFIYRNNTEQFQSSNYLKVKPVKENGLPYAGAKVQIDVGDMSQYTEITPARGMYSVSEQLAHFGVGNSPNVDMVKVTWRDNTTTVLTNVRANQTLTIEKKENQIVEREKSEPLFSEAKIKGLDDLKHLENHFDDYRYQVLLPHKLSQEGPAVAVGDVNGDNLDDLYFGASVGLSGSVLLQTKEGAFTESPQPVIATHARREDIDAVFLDVDLDGDKDLLVTSGGNEFEPGHINYTDRLYLNDGMGNFTSSQELDSRQSSSKVRLCDFDNDGDLDAFIGGRLVPRDYPSPASSVLLVNVNGTLANRTEQIAPELNDLGLVTDATWTDVDGDDKPELVVVGEWMPLTIFKYKNQRLEKTGDFQSLENQIGWWYSITSADMDNDGDQDLIAGNLGLNYKYKASKEEPFEVHYDDFDDNGSKDIVLSYYNFGKQFPLRGRSCSSEQVPELKKKFPTYNMFASSDLFKIYGETSLQEALHYRATNFGSAYIENMGGGKFEFHTLPVEAQFSSVNSILVDDYNNDGHKDILLAGNLYGSEVETTRNDAGIGHLLLGNGNGMFEPVPAKESGLYLDSDIKQGRILNIADKKHVVFGVNNGRVRIQRLNDN